MLPGGCIKVEKRYAYLPVTVCERFVWLQTYYAVHYFTGSMWIFSHNLLNQGQLYKCLHFYYQRAREEYLSNVYRDAEGDKRAFDKVDFQAKQLKQIGWALQDKGEASLKTS